LIPLKLRLFNTRVELIAGTIVCVGLAMGARPVDFPLGRDQLPGRMGAHLRRHLQEAARRRARVVTVRAKCNNWRTKSRRHKDCPENYALGRSSQRRYPRCEVQLAQMASMPTRTLAPRFPRSREYVTNSQTRAGLEIRRASALGGSIPLPSKTLSDLHGLRCKNRAKTCACRFDSIGGQYRDYEGPLGLGSVEIQPGGRDENPHSFGNGFVSRSHCDRLGTE
jgi:hypothetical protein